MASSSSDSSAKSSVKLGFVIPWYGVGIGGGAEAECRSLVHMLRDDGHEVEVLTTCVKDFRSDWSKDYHAPGLSSEERIPVRRFRVRPRNTAAFDAVNLKLMENRPISAREERTFFQEMVHSPGLYAYLGAHAAEYLYFFIPYMFGTTVEGTLACPERSVLIPCLHDESYATQPTVRRMFDRVAAMVFHTEEEFALAQSLYGIGCERAYVLGEPVTQTGTADAAAFRRRHGLRDFILYAGRTDRGKNVELLLSYFEKYRAGRVGGPDLVFMGGVPEYIPPGLAHSVHSLGRLPEREKRDCFAASLAVCVPGTNESFSLVLAESWLAGRPAIVNGDCAVTSGLCLRANGGLFFHDEDEFAEIVEYMRANPVASTRMGQQGGAFVRAHYSPQEVARRYRLMIEGLLP